MKHRKQNKILALLLAVAMIASMLPIGMISAAADAANDVYTVDFNEAEDLNDFVSYYAQNARDGLTATAFAEDWTNDGNVARLAKPHGIGGFWQSNVDGNGAYGYVTELVYTKQQYTNFELTVDAMQVAESIGRQFGIGFGKTELGAFFVDGNNQMNVKGGAYVGVERNGATSLWGYAANTVSSSNAIASDGRVKGPNVTSPCSKWHTVKVRVENGTVSAWVKDLGAEDSTYVQILTNVALKNYTGGYISLMTNANAAFDNLTIENLDPQLVSVEPVEAIEVAKGTSLDKIGLPQTIAVTDTNGNSHQVPVSFSCDNYDGTVVGTYTFTGTLDISNAAVQNGSNLTVSLTVTVKNSAEISTTVSVDFNEASDLNDFVSYYAQNARNGLTATAFAEDWTNDGNVARLAKPHGIGGFWQSNVDGNGAYGYVAELVYTKQQYTNFELTVDAMQVAESIGRQFGIGFGKTELGAFFVDGNNQMNVKGGAYVGVERNGATSLWGYAANTVSSSNTIASDGRVKGPNVTSPCSKWHTVKVRVENGTVSAWVKDLGAEDSTYVQILTNVALKNYKGGYISLMTNANAAFDNLTIENLDPQLVSVEPAEAIEVTKGTALEDISFPLTATATDANGNTYQVPVTFVCDSYNADVLGDYTFTGILDMSGVAAQNGSELTVSLTVSVKDAVSNTVTVDFNETADLNAFAAYYADNAKKGLQEADMFDNWTINNGIVERVKPADKDYWWSNADVYEAKGVGMTEYGLVTELVYMGKTYTNFELEVDVRRVSGIARYAAVGFGKTDPTAFFIDEDAKMYAAGGAYAMINRGDKTAIWGYLKNTVNGSGTAMEGSNVRVEGSNISGNQGEWCHLKLRVEYGVATMWIEGTQVATAVLKDYTGGYISLHTSANAAFDNLTITDLGATPAAQVAGRNISLGDDIGANFYIDIPEGLAQNTDITVTVAGDKKSVNAAELTVENGYYVVSTNVAAAQMTEEIALHMNCGGTVTEKTYSVYEYAQYILADVNNEFDEKTEALVKEMLNYGAAAQVYFDYNTDNTIAAELITGAGATEVAPAETAMSVDSAIDGVTFYGATLLFRSKTAVRFYFTGDISECEVNVGTIKEAGDGKYYVEIGGIAPQSLNEAITLTVTSGEQSISVTYGPMNYMERMSEKGSENLQLLLKAMYNYYLAAAAYVG